MAAGNWIEQAVNFAVFVILARLLGAQAFGILAMASVVIVLSEFLVRETFAEGLISVPNSFDVGPAHTSTVRGSIDSSYFIPSPNSCPSLEVWIQFFY